VKEKPKHAYPYPMVGGFMVQTNQKSQKE